MMMKEVLWWIWLLFRDEKEYEIPDEQTTIIENEWDDCSECVFRDSLFGIDGID